MLHSAPPKRVLARLRTSTKISPGPSRMHGARLRVTVRDDGVGLTEQMGQGFGLSNIHERLQLLYGERASLTVESAQPSGVEATLAIPMDVKPE